MNKHALGMVLSVVGALISGCGGTVELPSSSAAPACAFHAGALPAETLPAQAPHGDQLPIDHIIVVMQENRSFDSYFGQLPAFGHPEVDGLPATARNPDSDGTPVPVFHQTRYCTTDTDHSWTASHEEYDGGKNDGFVIANNPDGARALGYYDASDLPFYYALAKTFAMSDRYFSSLLGPTFPNRFYLLTGTSFGHIRNDMTTAGFTQPTVFDALTDHHVSWKVYRKDLAYIFYFKNKHAGNVVQLQQFYSDAAAGLLPQVAFIDSGLGTPPPELDEHPPADVQQGQQVVAAVMQAVMNSPNWPSSAAIFVYDEHGGFYDHVPPPPACVPDDIAPMLDSKDPASDFPARFDRYGFRVPMVVVSPYAKPGFVSHTIYDHTSILRLIETRFDLPALTNRDANANPLLDLFDFSNPALLNPPLLPEATVDAARLQQCKEEFPGQF